MYRHVTLRRVAGPVAIWGLLFLAAPLLPQVRAQEDAGQSSNNLAQSVQDLEAKIRELTAALTELRTEVARSRQESRELRQELRETREQFASLTSQPAMNPGRVTPPVTAAAGPMGQAHASEEGRVKLEEQLRRVEENQQLLGAKIDEQYQTKVESSSKYKVRLSGIALLNLFENRGAVDNLDVPNLAHGRTAFDSGGSFGATLRQSMLGLELLGPNLAGAKTGADVQFDFFGGFPNTTDGVTAGLVRLRTARFHMDWKQTSIVAGQDAPFFSPLSPTSLASLAYPPLSYSGNLWTWTPQVRIEHRVQLTDNSNFLLQGGILDPLTGELPSSQFYRSPQAGERSRQPAYASRVAWTGAGWGGPLSVGVGGYYARQNWGFDRTVDAWASTADWSVPLGHWFSLTGEFYRGRAIGGLGAGLGRSVLLSDAITSPTASITGLDTAGGWSQLKFHPTERWEFNGAFGEDVPYSQDLNRFPYAPSYVGSSLGRNQSGFVNAIFRARSNLLFSAEYRRLWTSEIGESKYKADHLNLSVGVLF